MAEEKLRTLLPPEINDSPSLRINKKTHGSGNKTLYRIEVGQNFYWLKVYPEEKKFRQETNAYKLIKEQHIPSTPEMLHAITQPCFALLITECGGTATKDIINNNPDKTYDIFSKAGEFLKQLHAITPQKQDTTPPLQAIQQRFAALIRNNHKTNYIPVEEIKRFEYHMNEL